MRKPQTERMREYIGEEGIKNLFKQQQLIINNLRGARDKFGKYSEEYKELDKGINFLFGLFKEPDKQYILQIINSLYPDIEKNNFTTTEELRQVIFKNRPDFINQLQLSTFSKRTSVFGILQKMEKIGILIRDKNISYIAPSKNLSRKGVFRIDKDKVKEYFGIELKTILEMTSSSQIYGSMNLNNMLPKEVTEKFERK